MIQIGDIVETNLGFGEVLARRSASKIIVRYDDGVQLLTDETEIIDSAADQEGED